MERTIESEISEYIRKNRVSLRKVARETGIPYRSLYNSLLNKDRSRPLRAWEYVGLCEYFDEPFGK